MRKAKSSRRREKHNTVYRSKIGRGKPQIGEKPIPKIRKLSWTFNDSPDPVESEYTREDLIGVFDRPDSMKSPLQYTSHPSGIECIQITEHMGFNLGNVVKYIWRAPYRTDQISDLKKAAWYILREISRLEQSQEK